MNDKIPAGHERFLSVNEIYTYMLQKRFPGVTFEAQRSIIYTCAEECHQLLMQYWQTGVLKRPVNVIHDIILDSKMDQLEECLSCFNFTVDIVTGICQECQFNNRQ